MIRLRLIYSNDIQSYVFVLGINQLKNMYFLRCSFIIYKDLYMVFKTKTWEDNNNDVVKIVVLVADNRKLIFPSHVSRLLDNN